MSTEHEYVEGVCAKCGDVENAVIICGPGRLQYLPRLHQRGARKWELVGEPMPTIAGAFRKLGKALDEAQKARWPEYNRADILAIEPQPSYYEPWAVYEVNIP